MQGREVFPAPLSQKIYSKCFAAVDQNACDIADYTTSKRTNGLYFQIMFWLLDKVVHTMFVICCTLAKGGVGP